MTARLYVHYGCGLSAPAEWLNFDTSPRLRLERLPAIGAAAGIAGKRLFPRNVRYGDIVAGLPVAPDSADAVYASHVLEHLARNDVEAAIANTFRVLKPGGVFRLIVPDLRWRAARYLHGAESGEEAAADIFIDATGMGMEERRRGVVGLLRAAFGNADHRWLYDEPLLAGLLTKAGFVGIRRCSIGDGGDPMFDHVEDKGRFYDHGEAELALEARKPQ
jgi:predicted SAM-dependent methyltransferase